MTSAERLQDLLALRWPPVAIAFLPEPPAGLPRIATAAPAGCGYWKLAAGGQAFYTEAADHYNCPVGALTHGIELPPGRAGELEQVAGMMVGLEYIRPEEIPAIARRRQPFGVAAYAPLAAAPFQPDTVLVRLNARQLMLLNEAAGPAGIMGRPTCAILAEAAERGASNASLACIGNRVYTGLEDGEAYFAFPAADLASVLERLEAVLRANRELEVFHRARRV